MRRCALTLLVCFTASLNGDDAATAVFAGGCFWCMEPPYDELDGVLDTTSGYTGGHVDSPTYSQVTAGGTGHFEAVQIKYDPAKVSYDTLLQVFWMNVDPFDGTGQFCDKGPSYRTAIFVASRYERERAAATKAAHETRFESMIATEILDARTFYPAEDYHQDYYLKNPLRYKYYRFSCGRDSRLQEVWGGE
ncbi:MAG: peptide-methionine (S)-S-oxide reductase MsrA [Gammaproteobacteria bacterium]|nr:peptide-methionine (S)-S-oxide reductase MsrA [Gammaproteobacteria bacterium]